jgi:DNA-directed RNA polymerase
MRTFTGKEYVKIAIANAYGLDRKVWDERLNWVDTHYGKLFDHVEEAKEPFAFVAGIKALDDANNGTPTGYIMGLDATCSGVQIMGTVTNCYKTAKCVNLVNTGYRECLYQLMADYMGEDRDTLKKPVMTTFYGSTAQPKRIFGTGERLKKYYQALETNTPGAIELMGFMQDCWDHNAYSYTWTLPDKHTVVMKVMDTVDKKIEVDELDHSTFTYRCEVNQPIKQGLSLAANIVHSIDGYVVREMVRMANKQGFSLLPIHDCFYASPNHMNKVRQNYVTILAKISKMNLMDNIFKQVLNNPKVTFEPEKYDLASDILKSEYAIS